MKLSIPWPTSQRTLIQRYGDNCSISVVWVTHLQPELKKYITDSAIYFQNYLYIKQFLVRQNKTSINIKLAAAGIPTFITNYHHLSILGACMEVWLLLFIH